MSTIINKPWGREIITTATDLPYSGKILEVKSGKRLSLQYHDQKTETLTIISGQASIFLNNEEKVMVQFEGYTVKPTNVHRITAITDCQIMEVSTPEIGTTHRLEDDFERTDENNEVRNSPNRGWQKS